MTRVVGIVLVRDEDVFVERAVRNVSDFRDETPSILRELAAELPQARFEAIDDPWISHERPRPYIGTDTWVFGVDGDEIYDPASLPPMRARLDDGEFADWFLVKGIQLHCRAPDRSAETATGWVAPPARSTTMLYNFAPLSGWEGRPPERLMSDGARFSREVEGVRWLRDEHPWGEAPLRCLHVCFLRRSSRQPRSQTTRLSYVERIAGGRRAMLTRLLGELVGRPAESWWKLNKYAQGDEVTVSIPGFLAEGA